MCKRYSGKEGILKIDFKHARGVFENYLNGYDRNDEKIKLKSFTHMGGKKVLVKLVTECT